MTLRYLIFILALFATSNANLGEEAAKQYNKGRTIQAMRVYLHALNDAIIRADFHREVIYLNNIAVLFYSLGEKDSANIYFEKATRAAHGKQHLLAPTELNKALISGTTTSVKYDLIKKWEDSLSIFESAALYIAAGRIATSSKEYKEAEKSFSRAKKLLKKEQNSNLFADAAHYNAKVAIEQGKLNEGEKELLAALAIYQNGAFLPGIKKAIAALIHLYKKKGDSEKAVQYQMFFDRIRF